MIILKKIRTLEIIDEDLLGTIDGINTSFLSSKIFNPETVIVYLNGIKLVEGVSRDYIKDIDNQTINFIYPPTGNDAVNIVYTTQ